MVAVVISVSSIVTDEEIFPSEGRTLLGESCFPENTSTVPIQAKLIINVEHTTGRAQVYITGS